MAGRKSKKTLRTLEDEIKWKVGIYLRLSSDDGDKEESNSITNQKLLVENYLKKEENLKVFEIYTDDGYSGTSFDRPAFKKLFGDIVNGKINTIITKDLSRFGRNYIEVGRYIEDILPMYNVRFIAINDNIDSYKDPKSINSMIVPFKNLLNDEYARDISNKVRSAYISMSKEGKFVGGTPPYGYKKNPKNKHQLIIDEEEAKIVRIIFSKTINGMGRIKLLSYLNQNNILCRKEKQRQNKLNLIDKEVNEIVYRWSGSTIEKILSSEIYIGNLVWGRTSTKNYKNRTQVYKPKEEWIIVKNTHEPIISLSDFEKVNKLQKDRFKKHETNKSKQKRSIYEKKIVCGNCGRAMVKTEDYRRSNPYIAYSCRSRNLYNINCEPHSIKNDLLTTAIIEGILQQVKLIFNLEKVMNTQEFKNKNLDNQREIDIKINKCINSIKKENVKKKQHYEDWKLNAINKNQYSELSNSVNERTKKLEEELETFKKIKLEIFNDSKDELYWIEKFKKNRKIKELSKEVIEELIDKIEIYNKNKVKITFKYQDEYAYLLKLIEESGVKI